MIRLDDNFLAELGLAALPTDDKKQMLAQIYETLEMRVGMKLAENMSDQQLQDFERLMDAKDEAGAFQWLQTNVPNYKEVVKQELDILKEEVRNSAPQILQASQVNIANQASIQQTQSQPPANPANTAIPNSSSTAIPNVTSPPASEQPSINSNPQNYDPVA